MYEITIFSGGLGSRLRNTETVPKPFVDINGCSLISRIIRIFNSTNLFSTYNILTCCNDRKYSEALLNELPDLNIRIYNEPSRTGRTGALKYFLNSNKNIENFFVANGDTLFTNLISSEILEGINSESISSPVAFLAKADPTRNDYLAINDNNFIESGVKDMQNSGLFYISRSWLNKFVFKFQKLKDIDHYLFSLKPKAIYFPLSSSVYDGGTPERLMEIRSLIK